MALATETIDRALITGGYDLLSQDHRLYILNCIKTARSEVGIDSITIGLLSDESLSTKGKHRPFYSYRWRQEDICNWYATVEPDQQVEFEEINSAKLLQSLPRARKYLLALIAVEHKGTPNANAIYKLAEEIVYVSSIDRFHTSDVEQTLQAESAASPCTWQSGAILLREGAIAGKYHHGGQGSDCCRSCSWRTDTRLDEEQPSVFRSSPLSCYFPHAESQAAAVAQVGDHLLTTRSPCWECAKEIAMSGIKRVVYLESDHRTQEAITHLADRGIQIRRAGNQYTDYAS